jgi:hypothetical protein
MFLQVTGVPLLNVSFGPTAVETVVPLVLQSPPQSLVPDAVRVSLVTPRRSRLRDYSTLHRWGCRSSL